MADLQTLLDRVRKATGPDRELDFWIGVRLRPRGKDSDADIQADIETLGIEAPYTSSINDVVALIERELPGARWGIHQPMRRGPFRAYVKEPAPFRPAPEVLEAATPALAILAAFLSAKIALEISQ